MTYLYLKLIIYSFANPVPSFKEYDLGSSPVIFTEECETPVRALVNSSEENLTSVQAII